MRFSTSSNYFQIYLALILLSASACLMTACDATTSSSAADAGGSDTGGDSGSDGVSLDPATDGFAAAVTQNENYSLLITKDGDGETPCVAEEGEVITCIVDMNELDLYINGYTLEWSVPQSQCDYVGWMPYYYSWAPYGKMPLAVLYNVDGDGIIQNNGAGWTAIDTALPAAFAAVFNNADPCAGVDNDVVYIFNVGGVYTPICHADIFGAPAATDADVRCPWDYTQFDTGSSCCYGDYTTYTYNTVDAEIQDATDADWGPDSNYANCFRGPGLDDSNAKTVLGLPAYIYTLVPAAGLTNSYAVASSISTSHDDQVYASNYFSAGDHTGNTATSSDTFHGETVSAPVNSAKGFPYYQLDCLDHDEELKAQIRIMVREWNTQANFEDFVAGTLASADTAGQGDPYDVGFDEDNDDYYDYKSLEDNGWLNYSSFMLNDGASLDSILSNASNFYMSFPAE